MKKIYFHQYEIQTLTYKHYTVNSGTENDSNLNEEY